MSMSCEVIAALRESILKTQKSSQTYYKTKHLEIILYIYYIIYGQGLIAGCLTAHQKS